MTSPHTTVRVDLGDRSYDVMVGHGVANEIATQIPSNVRRIAVVTQPSVPIRLALPVEHKIFEIGNGESNKSITTVENLCSGFADMGLTRNDLVIGVGGGMVTDVAGFAAAVFHRGVRVMHVATTRLAMVDAAIGGKTGVNLSAGKNLVGAFWQPSAVFCEMDALSTLPPEHMRGGLGELAKYHFISGDDFLSLDMQQRIARAVRIKADIVAADEREAGQRALLNYGHTLGHAVEIATNFKVQHGEAVAIGLVYAAHLAEVMGRISNDRVKEHYEVVGGEYSLTTALPQGCTPDVLLPLIANDKKALDGLTFVLDSPRGLEVVPGVSEQNVREALAAMEVR